MSTISDAIEKEVNNRYGKFDKSKLAQKILKDNVNVGEAIVNVLSHTGIAGFKFNIPEREEIKFQSEITDHFTDKNNAIQDQIAQKPITLTLTGLHGDYFYSVNKIEDAVAKIVPTLSLVKQFIPKLPDSTKQKLLKKYQSLNNSDKIPEALKTQKSTSTNEVNGVDLFSLFQELYKVTSSQTRAYLFLKALWKSKALFSVETTFERFDNMVILNMSPLRTDSADIAQFTITFKQFNFAETITTTAQEAVGRLSNMLSKPQNKGVDKGKEKAVA